MCKHYVNQKIYLHATQYHCSTLNMINLIVQNLISFMGNSIRFKEARFHFKNSISFMKKSFKNTFSITKMTPTFSVLIITQL